MAINAFEPTKILSHAENINVGDKVFAINVKGRRPWPAFIKKIEQKNECNYYHVIFYETFQTKICNASEVFPFKENEDKMRFLDVGCSFNSTRKEFHLDDWKRNNVKGRQHTYPLRQQNKFTLSTGNSLYPKVELNNLTDKNVHSPKTTTPKVCFKKKLNPTKTKKLSDLSQLSSKKIETLHRDEPSFEKLVEESSEIHSDLTKMVISKENTYRDYKETLARCLLLGQWLTDDTIQIFFDLLETKYGEEYSISFLSPSVSHAIKCLEDVDDIITPLQLSHKSYILVPVNDANSLSNSTSGSHWSMLVFIRSKKHFYYFDSLMQKNYKSAVRMVEKLSKHVSVDENDIKMIVQECPQQRNGKDCGVYMILVANTLTSRIVHLSNSSSSDIILNLEDYSNEELQETRLQLAYLVFHSHPQHLNKTFKPS